VGPFVAVIVLLVVLTLSLLITRVATEALVLTGLSRDLAKFQARSAFTGVGFTTSESERLLQNPVRRRIIMVLMILGNAGIVTTVASLMLTFVDVQGGRYQMVSRLVILICGLIVLWGIAVSKWVERQMSRLISYALTHWTRLEVFDYTSLLHFAEGYVVTEFVVQEDNWLAGKKLIDIRLADEGVHILGIHRAGGEYCGVPTGSTLIHPNDTLILYGQLEHITELDRRPADVAGDLAHREAIKEQETLLLRKQELERVPQDAISGE